MGSFFGARSTNLLDILVPHNEEEGALLRRLSKKKYTALKLKPGRQAIASDLNAITIFNRPIKKEQMWIVGVSASDPTLSIGLLADSKELSLLHWIYPEQLEVQSLNVQPLEVLCQYDIVSD